MVTTILISFTIEYKGRGRAEISKFYSVNGGLQQGPLWVRQLPLLLQIRIQETYLDRMKYIRYSKELFIIRREDEKKMLTFLKRKGGCEGIGVESCIQERRDEELGTTDNLVIHQIQQKGQKY